MSKRFGEGVSLQDMEAFAVNRTLAELRETAKRAEENKYRRLEKKKVGTLYISFFLGLQQHPRSKGQLGNRNLFSGNLSFLSPVVVFPQSAPKKEGP